jgi:hypothetical protein
MAVTTEWFHSFLVSLQHKCCSPVVLTSIWGSFVQNSNPTIK